MALLATANSDYSRAEVARRCKAQRMKLWCSTANALQQSRCGEIGSPIG
jgi:hypothetical protein